MKSTRLKSLVLGAAATGAFAAMVATAAPPVESVPKVDLQRYAGNWFELARLPNRFQEKCERDVTANYQPLPDGSVEVVNRCREAGDKWEEAKGRATKVSGDDSGAKLKVSFLPSWMQWVPLGRGDYWVVLLDNDYRYAVVSEPSREYIWILSRTPTLDDTTYGGIIDQLRTAGYPVDKLTRTMQSDASAPSAVAVLSRMV